MYSHKKSVVRWGDATPFYFKISNGIRQGVELTPLLYAVYTDSINTRLYNSRIGCHKAGEFLNHTVWADDMGLLAPLLKALQI